MIQHDTAGSQPTEQQALSQHYSGLSANSSWCVLVVLILSWQCKNHEGFELSPPSKECSISLATDQIQKIIWRFSCKVGVLLRLLLVVQSSLQCQPEQATEGCQFPWYWYVYGFLQEDPSQQGWFPYECVTHFRKAQPRNRRRTRNHQV